MKKLLLVLVFMLALSLCLVSCSGGADGSDDGVVPGENGDTPPAFDSSAIVGVWELYCATSNGTTYNLGDFLNGQTLYADMMVFDFKADGTGIYTLKIAYGDGEREPEDFSISWDALEDSWVVHINGSHNATTMVDGKLIVNDAYNNVLFTYVRKTV